MGGSQSTPTRKISIPNEESHFIKVSESVAERLRKCTEGNPEDVIKPPENECPPLPEAINVRNVQNIENIPINSKIPGPGSTGDALINYYYGPSITSLRVLQEKEKELKESEDYWTKRIQNVEMHHQKLSKIMEEEYDKAVKEISCQTPRPPPGTPFPCCEQKTKLIECYRKNPNEILLCAGEVTEFSDCIHAKRIHAERPASCDAN